MGIHLLVTDFEVDVKSIKYSCLVQVAYYVLYHSCIEVALPGTVISGLFAHLDPC